MSRKYLIFHIKKAEKMASSLPAFRGEHVVKSQQLPVAHVAFGYNLHVYGLQQELLQYCGSPQSVNM